MSEAYLEACAGFPMGVQLLMGGAGSWPSGGAGLCQGVCLEVAVGPGSLFFFFLATLRHTKFPGRESDPSHSESLTHCAGTRIKPSSQHFRVAADPIALRWKLYFSLFFCSNNYSLKTPILLY